MSQWEAGKWYNPGDRVEYNGQYFNVIQGHRSQGDWLPPQVPALYGAGGSAHHDQHGQQHYGGQPPQQQWGAPPQQGYPQGGPGTPGFPQPGHGPGTPGQVAAPPPPTKYSEQHGFDDKGSDESDASDDEYDKKKLAMQIGGGVGLAALVGGGIYAYTKHKSKKAEEAKKEAWSENANEKDWQAGAQQRAVQITNARDKPPCYWVLAQRPGDIPQNAIQVGHEADGAPLYAARAFYEGGLHIGKAGKHFNPPGAIISWGGRAVTVEKYEVLVGDARKISWKRFDEKPYVRGWQPVDAGREADGTFLFLAKTDNYNGGVHPGKVREDENEIHFGYGDGEVKSRPFYIAAYA